MTLCDIVSDMKYLSVTEYAERYKLGRATVRRWAHNGQIECKRVGRQFRIPENALPRVRGYEPSE
ncbi:MAG: excisionase family DNA-binding protein [Acutalibacteraceae bacterium]